MSDTFTGAPGELPTPPPVSSPDGAAPFPGLGWGFLLIVLIQVLANVFAGIGYVVMIVMGGGLEVIESVDAAGLGIVANSLGFGLVIYFAWRRTGVPWEVVVPLGPAPPATWLPMAVTLAGGLLVINDLSSLLLKILPAPEFVRDLFAQFLGKGRGTTGFVFLVFVAPITEEFMFRGVMIRSFKIRYGARRAIVWSSVLFGLIHILPWQVVPAFFLGLLFAWWTIETGSLWPALLGHAGTNGLAFFQSLSQEPSDVFAVSFQPLWLTGLGVLVLFFGIRWSAGVFRRLNETPPAAERSFS